MGIKYSREYKDIIKEFAQALRNIEGFYDFIGMDEHSWNSMSDDEKNECSRTMADDIFYALGELNEISVGDSIISYDGSCNVIRITSSKCKNVITL